jgi:small conductance mechanosensitive channel
MPSQVLAVLFSPQSPAGSPGQPAPAALPPADERLQDWLWTLAMDWGLKLVAALLLLVASWFVAHWVQRGVARLLNRPFVDKTVGNFVGTVARWAVLILGLLTCLGLFGVNVTSLAAVLGAAGLAIGLALQGSLSNLAAGVMLLVLRPFKVGDAIQVGSTIGKVFAIDLFHTMLDTADNRRLIIPNAAVFGGSIENLTHHTWRRCDVPVGVAYDADTERTRKVLTAAAEALAERQADKPVEVLLLNLGNNAVEWVVRVWVPTADLAVCRDRLIASIKRRLDEAKIGIPFPQLDVWVRGRNGV